MGKWGKVDIKGLKQLQKQLEQAAKNTNKVMYDIANEIAEEFLQEVIQRTPSSDNNQLKNAWTKQVVPSGNGFNIIIENKLQHASFVEYGHKTEKGGWKQGYYMLHITEQDIMNRINKIGEPILDKYLREIFK